MFQEVPCLKSPKDSRAVASADMSVLLPSVIPLAFRMAIGSPGSFAGVSECMSGRMVWLGARTPSTCGRNITGVLGLAGILRTCKNASSIHA